MVSRLAGYSTRAPYLNVKADASLTNVEIDRNPLYFIFYCSSCELETTFKNVKFSFRVQANNDGKILSWKYIGLFGVLFGLICLIMATDLSLSSFFISLHMFLLKTVETTMFRHPPSSPLKNSQTLLL